MSIQSEIERISQAKTDIHSAIESKGVTVPDDTLISEMAPYIQQIREAGTVVTSVNSIGPDGSGNVELTATNIGAAPTMHSVTNTTYGVGSKNYYGHVRLSDSTSPAYGQNSGVAATPLAVYSVNSRVDNVEDSVPITRRITVSSGWSTSYGDTGTDFRYGRIVSFTGSTTSHEVTGIYVTGQYTGSSPTDSQKTAAATWTYVECENNQLHFYSPTAISTTFYLVVTIQRL